MPHRYPSRSVHAMIALMRARAVRPSERSQVLKWLALYHLHQTALLGFKPRELFGRSETPRIPWELASANRDTRIAQAFFEIFSSGLEFFFVARLRASTTLERLERRCGRT
jgi:hypothetical protein